MIIFDKLLESEKVAVSVNSTRIEAPAYRFGAIVVGSGAAGLNCAELIGDDVAIVTEGLYMGTSRNTGSDKQTYYKLTLSGDTPDSVGDMAKSYFDGGAMDGDLALVEASGSARAFFRLVELGVPFPFNEVGEFAGYQTDHDTRTRATSCGPLTSKFMTEALTEAVKRKNIPIFDNCRIVKLLCEENDQNRQIKPRKIRGAIAICPEIASDANPYGLVVFLTENLVWACGGPSAIYASTVYPESQTCAHGVLFDIGAAGVNLTESQYGIASVKFRWNLSGTYQQVLPRYISTAPDGSDEREFLDAAFATPERMLTAIFRKGYQWPFDPAKLDRESGNESSLVDIAVFRERQSGRRVFLDFRRNLSVADKDGTLDRSLLSDEVRSYLASSNGLAATPIERLAAMNSPAIELYRNHGIDLYSEPLEIDICAQHNNGGFAVDADYRSINIDRLYIVGEAAGVFGIHRPGGSALNSTQVGSRRAAEALLFERRKCTPDFSSLPEISLTLPRIESGLDRGEILAKRLAYGEKMSACGAFIRDRSALEAMLADVRRELAHFDSYTAANAALVLELEINRDILRTQEVYIAAILEYIAHGGKSRGSYLITDSDGLDREHFTKVCEVYPDEPIGFVWRDVRPIPERENWFERVYNSFREKRF